jgi:quinol monooxygenase YgiN
MLAAAVLAAASVGSSLAAAGVFYAPSFVPDGPARMRGDDVSLFVTLELQAADGKADEMIEVLKKALVDTRARKGCESVEVYQDQNKPGAVFLVERWATREDDTAYREWRAGDGAITEMAGLVTGAAVRYFDDVDA